MAASGPPPLLSLDAAAVRAALPNVPTALALGERALRALAQGTARLPPKIGLTPRPPGSFAHAMPAWLGGAADDGSADLLGVKWIVGFPGNGERGLAALHATVVLNDGATGQPRAILDGAPITACRTAAVSGLAIRRFADPAAHARPPARVAFLGAGVQARAHLPVVAHLLPGASIAIFDHHPERAEALALEAGRSEGLGEARATGSAQEAVAGADVVLTMVSFGPPGTRQALDPAWLAPRALVVSVDYDMSVPAATARGAAAFLTDERAQFAAAREAGWFAGYPDPMGTLGEVLAGSTPVVPADPDGLVLASHLGLGLLDLVFADAVVRASLDAAGGHVTR
ncbi:MAG TPA: NAD(P)-binding domain-containing protein [Candidatus Limnocylindrales bacterium]|nr:NAD(P)-binding domain-containing protein [Candidatus Limnocylindrales bacterium]